MDLAKTLAKYSDTPIFYVTLDPERALGLEDILPNYTIICPYKSQLTESLHHRSVRELVLEAHLAPRVVGKIVERGTYGILRSDLARKYINANLGHGKPHIMVLKNSQLIEDFCKKQGWYLLAPKAKVAEQFENKTSQYKALKNVVPYPKSFVTTTGALDDNLLKSDFNKRVVLQFNRGHSGNSTFFIKSKKDLKNINKLFQKREVKISEYIKGKTYTLNCLVLSNGEVLTGSISEQITGIKSATSNPNTTCGNDFDSPKKLSRKTIKAIQKIAKDTGKVLYKNKYKGLFGIDVIIDMSRKSHGTKHGTDAENTNAVYFIEVNTHQPASISFEAKLHRKIGKAPLLAYFILDSLAEGGGWNLGILSQKRDAPPLILPISAKQIVYRNKISKILTQQYVEKEYKGRGVMTRMKYIKSNEEIYRIQYGV